MSDTDAGDRFAALVEALSARPGVTGPEQPGGRGFGSTALKVDGAIFAMPWRGAVVFKLPAERVASLLAAGEGSAFDAGKGRPMREWVAVGHGSPDPDLALAEEAMAHVRAGRRPRDRAQPGKRRA